MTANTEQDAGSAQCQAGTSNQVKIPEKIYLKLGNNLVAVIDDEHSDRVRCDHPNTSQGTAVAFFLAGAAHCLGRSKVLTMVEESLAGELIEQGFTLAGTMPGFYRGDVGCSVLTCNLDERRKQMAHPKEGARVGTILDTYRPVDENQITERYEFLGDDKLRDSGDEVQTILALPSDAEKIAPLIDITFRDYPTPSHDPNYIRTQIESGVPFRYVEDNGRIVACASADLVPDALTAELTDCATLPEYRKKGYMMTLLADLMWDLQQKKYCSAFTYSRVRVPGINVLFKKLGFAYCGCVHQSCRIGEGLEDMNMWIRPLPRQDAEYARWASLTSHCSSCTGYRSLASPLLFPRSKFPRKSIILAPRT